MTIRASSRPSLGKVLGGRNLSVVNSMMVCSAEKAFYRVTVGMLYCAKARSTIILESFVPSAAFTAADARALETLRCL